MTPGGEVITSKRFGDVQDGNAWYYFNYDMRGSTTEVLTPTGSYKKDYEYDTFGNTTEGEGSSTTKRSLPARHMTRAQVCITYPRFAGADPECPVL